MILCFSLVLPLIAKEKYLKDPSFKKGVSYFFQKKYEMAELMFQEAVKKNPENKLAYTYLGDLFLRKKRYNAALNSYKKALDIDPQSAENYFRMGQVYYHKKEGKNAIKNFTKAFEMDKTIKFAYYHIGLSYLMLLRDKQNTIKNWESFLRIAPEDPQYEKIKRVLALLKDPRFKIPPIGSEVSIQEALLLGGTALKKVDHKTTDKKAGNEKKKTKKKFDELYTDDDM